MKNAMAGIFMKNMQKEVKGASAEHIKLLSDFSIPLHKYNKIKSEEEKDNFILDHMVHYIKNLVG